MPITLLHFGALAPVNAISPRKLNVWSFAAANIWIDAETIAAFLMGAPFPSHGTGTHTLSGLLMVMILVALPGVRSWSWVLGAVYGVFSHWLLDSLVHADMRPFPWLETNPMYLGWMEPLSLFLLPLTLWFVVSFTLEMSQKIRQTWKTLFG